MMRRRSLFWLALGASASGRTVAAASSASAVKTSEFLYVNDGGGAREVADALAAYRPLSTFLAASTRAGIGLRVAVRGESFAAVLRADKPLFAFVKSVEHAGAAIRDDGYSVVARVDAPYVASFIASKSCTAKKLEDLAGSEILLPAGDTFTAKLAVATLRSKGMRTKEGTDETGRLLPREPGVVTLRHTRSDEAVFTGVGGGFYPDWGVDGGAFQQVGAVNPDMAVQWKAKGGRILHEMPPMPGWCLLAAGSVPEGTRKQLQRLLVAMGEAERTATLSPFGAKRMVEGADNEYVDALKFVRVS